MTVTRPGTPGHERLLHFAWVVAEFGDPANDATSPLGIAPAAIAATRHAMTCGELAELRESVRAPLTAERFWLNLKGAWRRSRIIIPSDPVLAEQKFCAQP